VLVCPPARLLIACLFEPCSRLEPPALANRGGLFGGAIRDGGFRCFCQIWFYWVDALLPFVRRAKKIRDAPLSSVHPCLSQGFHLRTSARPSFFASLFEPCSRLSRFAPSPFPRPP